jgi:hypothetical protein
MGFDFGRATTAADIEAVQRLRYAVYVEELGGRPFIDTFDLRLVFGCCEPHLLSLFLGMGQRPYADHNINSPSADI